MRQDNLHSKMVASINEILDGLNDGNKTTTLARQRGYLTGWLARLATKDWMIREELEARLRQQRSKKISGAGSEDRTRN